MGGPDVIRDEAGELVCLEDNVRTPTMLAFAIACARAVRGDDAADALAAEARELITAMLAHAAGAPAPRAVLLGDGAQSVVRWELGQLAALAGIEHVEAGDLAVHGDELRTRDGQRVDVVWRRTSEERLAPFADLLERPLRAGTLVVVNAFGAGVADDKRTYAYVEDLVRFFLGEEPLLRSVPTWDLANPEHRERAEAALPELVVKPRGGSGGYGVLIRPDRLPDDAEHCIAQRPVDLSQHPTVNAAGELEPRHVDLRPYVFRTVDGWRVLQGAFSRVAARPNDLIVNCSQGGGGKDVWIVDGR
jgi:carboxylate-amine ligase